MNRGRIETVWFESAVLRGNPLGDPHVRLVTVRLRVDGDGFDALGDPAEQVVDALLDLEHLLDDAGSEVAVVGLLVAEAGERKARGGVLAVVLGGDPAAPGAGAAGGTGFLICTSWL